MKILPEYSPDILQRKSALYLLTIIFCAAGALRLKGLNASYWLDEILSHKRADQALSDVLISSAYPFSTFLSWSALKLGNTESMLRLPNFLAGMASIPVIYYFCKVTAGASTGIIAALTLAFSAYHLAYSQDGRYYALMILFGTLSLLYVYKFITSHRYEFCLYFSVSAACGLATQPMFSLYVMSICVPAAIILIFQSGTPRWSTRALRVLFLFISTLIATVPALLLWRHYESFQLADNIASPLAETGNGRRLTFTQYISFFMDKNSGFFAFYGLVARICLISISALGLASLYIWNRLAAVLLTGSILLNPMPFFFIEVSSPFYARYFICQITTITAFFAFGSASLATIISYNLGPRYLRIIKESADPNGMLTKMLFCICIVAPTTLIAPSTAKSLHHYYSWSLERSNWRDIARRMVMDMTEEDVIIYLHPSTSPNAWKYLSREPLEFYLNKLSIAGKPSTIPNTAIGFDSNDDFHKYLAEIARRYPFSTLWLVLPRTVTPNEDVSSKLQFTRLVSSPNTALWVLGRPGFNMVSNGGFENATGDTPKNLPYTTPNESFSGKRSVKFACEMPGHSHAGFKIVPRPYFLRNSEFRVWDAGLPVGWRLEKGDGSALKFHTKLEGEVGLEFTSKATISQTIKSRLDSGSTVTITALGKSSRANQLGLRVQYKHGDVPTSSAIYHSGSGKWESVELQFAVPVDTSLDELKIEISAASASPGCFLRNVEIQTDHNRLLDPEESYTLTLWVKTEKLHPHKWKASTGRLALAGKTAAGKKFWRDLKWWSGTNDWHRYAVTLNPKNDEEIRNLTELSIHAGIYGGSGIMFIDNLQLQPLAITSPFIEDKRLPHDEILQK